MNTTDIEYLVFSAHKTATQSVVNTIRTSHIRAKHAHTIHHMDGEHLSLFLDRYYEDNGKPLKIISVFREPISRLISSFFQTYGDDHVKFLNKKRDETLIELSTVNQLINVFTDELTKRKLPGYTESIDYLIDNLSIDDNELVYEENKKLSVYKKIKFELYLIRFDVLTSYYVDIMSSIIGVDVVFKAHNLSGNKWYADKYKLFTDGLNLDTCLIDQVYQDKQRLISLFYGERADTLLQQTKSLYCPYHQN